MADHAMGFAGLRAEIAARVAESRLAEQMRQAVAGIVVGVLQRASMRCGGHEEKARPVAADRALNTETINSGEPLHVRNLGHGARECPGEITTEKVGEQK
ncbi:hypothetical protein KTR66_19460 [Roseococcus sp. SDR]|uniref:hypothetical protein n=1 Tax=Roseococcus sp. SDR TaxID=2835532 RepID=UPI001BCCF031|nr:hypothetical protein [Roseococcus sp. SDR]MBS7792186.1 hypothetical protein [Roseococcus sp. SDR]MBV1847500.1 hypothetical protein [Roseococcus sp. SDR]